MLIAVGQRLTGALRPGDSLARLSGDEFVVLCEDLADPSEADPIAVRLDTELSQPYRLASVELTVTASIGIAFAGEDSDAPEDLLRDADLAMYRAKRERARTRGILDLRNLRLAGNQAGLSAWAYPGAIARNELHLAYQPIVDANDGRLTGVEALLRWTHPRRGPVAPTVFIPVRRTVWPDRRTRRNGCLNKRGQTASVGNSGKKTPITVAVNVSAHQLMSAGFTQAVATVLDSASVDPGLLMLEMTETVFVHDEQRALVVLTELVELGVQVALDDFGTGYSSLGYLNHHLPINTIKIDRQFIANLDTNPDSKVIVTAMIQLAHGLDMTVISEGVETARQHQTVTSLGTDGCQGFYFAGPMRTPEIDAPHTTTQRGQRTPPHRYPRASGVV